MRIRTTRGNRATLLTAGALLTAGLLSACSGDDSDSADDETIVVYVGRDQELVEPLIDQFEEETGITVDARWGDTIELANQIIEEGDNVQADVFLSQDAGALGLLSRSGVTQDLDAEITDRVDSAFTSSAGDWVAVTARARVIAYDSSKIDEADVPTTVAELTDPEWAGRVGFPPGNAGFQAFVTGFRVAEGDDAARDWLQAMQDNDVQIYERNGPLADAINEGEVELGLINHYYWYPRTQEHPDGADMPLQFIFPEDGDPGSLVNVTGAAKLSDHDAADEFIEYLLSEAGQQYFVDETSEYPVVAGIESPEGLPALETVQGPIENLDDLDDLEATLALIDEINFE